MRDELVPYSLAAVNFLWGIASLVDQRIRLHPGLPGPEVLAAIHLFSGMALVPRRIRLAGLLTTVVTSAYYSFRVKPYAPLAEPQTVGILLVALAAALDEVLAGSLSRLSAFLKPVAVLLLRGGVAYPFVEWGLDAVRNPKHFVSYISGNERALVIARVLGIENSVFLLSVLEIALASLIVLGLLRTLSALASATVLTVFMVVSGYPLAFPQNVALVAASLRLRTVELRSRWTKAHASVETSEGGTRRGVFRTMLL